jgi:hypothetical protein
MAIDPTHDVYPNDSRAAKLTLGGLSLFSVAMTLMILAVLFSPQACS